MADYSMAKWKIARSIGREQAYMLGISAAKSHVYFLSGISPQSFGSYPVARFRLSEKSTTYIAEMKPTYQIFLPANTFVWTIWTDHSRIPLICFTWLVFFALALSVQYSPRLGPVQSPGPAQGLAQAWPGPTQGLAQARSNFMAAAMRSGSGGGSASSPFTTAAALNASHFGPI